MKVPWGHGAFAEGPLSTALITRLAAAMWMLSSVSSLACQLVAPGTGTRSATLVMGAVVLAVGVVIWVLPWSRWPRSCTLVLVPVAFTTIGLDYRLTAGNAFLYAISFLMVFVWLGLAHPRWTSVAFSPLLVVGYVVPLVGVATAQQSLGVASVIYVIPCCVLVGEAVAWGVALLSHSESTLAVTRERYAGVFEEAPMGIGLTTADGVLVRVNRALADIVGYAPEQLEGVTLRSITHPDDWEATEENIRRLLGGEIERYSVEKRYLHADGHVVWVSVGTACVRDRGGAPVYLIGQVEDITERRVLRDRLAHDALHDQLTGLPNRVLFNERLEVALQQARRSARRVALLFLDLDRFKLVNDGLGHDAGDRLLQRVALRLESALRAGDLLARFGGDEFIVLCEVADEEEAFEVAVRLKATMEQPLSDPEHEQFVSLSIGIALSSSEVDSGASLLRNADVAMYRAKDRGPSRIALYREDDELQTVRSLQTSNELHRALERGQFVLHYQPFVDLRDHSLLGVEALVRWQHPARGLLLPGEFVSLAEDCGLIVPLGDWILREALGRTAAWSAAREAAGLEGWRLNVSVNVSPQQLADVGFPELLGCAIADSGVDADQVWIEITESAILGDPTAVIETLRTLRALGVHASIDDFGTGYSSLSYLKQLPVEILKIDRSFIDEVDVDPDDTAIVSAIIAMGRSLGLTVIAEGVERPAQAEQLARLGCSFAQGFLFARPAPPEMIGAYPTDDLLCWSPGARAASA